MEKDTLVCNHIYNMDCIDGLNMLPNNSIDLIVTSPPYYNAREYSQYKSLTDYLHIMENVFRIAFNEIKNHHYCIVNVGDITAQVGNAKWAVRKLPLGAYYITMLENIGYTYIDDYIWDKGEPQSKRNIGNPPYPFYQYPVNCYEHILVFCKHILDTTKIPCPDCHQTITQSNSCSGIGIQSWECKNPNCPTKSEHGRGKRFSARSIMMNDYQVKENLIPNEIIKKWRRDIVKISPVVKINNKGENLLGHTAPFPIDIPDMAIKFYSGVSDLVVDPFMGSGTTAIAAIQNNRKYMGFEINKEYYDIILKKIKNLSKTHKLF